MRPALDGLAGVIAYLADKNPDAAERIVLRLRQRAASLAHTPEQGRPGRLAGTRELSVAGTPYILFYRLRRGIVEIIRVHHSLQKWPPDS
ncbi:type II toxin-antitoxin system RelE/ParE family toxin [Labrys sp. LIt4]|nr:type II toxin-antitoxin system RelE/ParE family toxin [Labrys sp. LIt4]MBP0582440.1 type II toxin-antitoxin system RelE/ParE family toxin [Labrys sp. LIt4]